jgi:hypothetical protein
MEDYYALYGIFSSTRYPFTGSEPEPRQKDFVPLLQPDEVETRRKPYREKLAALDADIGRLEKEMAALQKEGFKIDPLQEQFDELWKKRDELTANPPMIDTAYAAAEGTPGNARLQKRGEPHAPGEEIPRRFLKILGGQELPKECHDSGRLELADWLTRPSNPLTARVMVNRLWQHHFGRGLVATPSDFGTRGRAPSHPELLDYLATRFIESGWSVKQMHRLMALSATYQQAGSGISTVDPNDVLLWRFPRRRLDAEEVRDALLAVSGTLDPTPGGPHPFPPESTWKFSQHFAFSAVYPTNKRSIYVMQQRIRRHPFFAVFDGADPNVTTAERHVSTTPLQALFAMNDPFAHEQAAKFAERILRERLHDRQRLDLAHQLAFARPPTADEIREGLTYLQRFRDKLGSMNVSAEEQWLKAWSSYLRALLGSNEFMFID